MAEEGESSFWQWPCGLMDKALVFGTKDCRFESCQGQLLPTILRVFTEGANIFSSKISSSGRRHRQRTLMHSIFEAPGTCAPANRLAIAQLVEHLTVECCSNQTVRGSMPGGRIFIAPDVSCRAICEELDARVLAINAIQSICSLSHRVL